MCIREMARDGTPTVEEVTMIYCPADPDDEEAFLTMCTRCYDGIWSTDVEKTQEVLAALLAAGKLEGFGGRGIPTANKSGETWVTSETEFRWRTFR